ncbi:MAG: hypothetical protein ACJA0N_000556 [Pseudohongiellaceae bacterium]|jgi:hypothetical protein
MQKKTKSLADKITVLVGAKQVIGRNANNKCRIMLAACTAANSNLGAAIITNDERQHFHLETFQQETSV